MRKKSHTGIRVRHARSCPAARSPEARCRCRPGYEAAVYSAKDGKKIRKTLPTLAAARGWRHDAATSIRKGTMRAPTQTTLRGAWQAWLEGAQDGTIRTRSGDPYKPSVIRSYAQAMELRILDDFGAAKLGDIGRVDVQDMADRLLAKGLDPSTVRNALMPLRALYRRALARGEVALNPTSGVELPAVRGTRDRIASPTEAAALVEALPESDQALWATALYAGLRRGELMALRWEDVDFDAGLIRVERSYDPTSGETVAPKSQAGIRCVPIAAVLRGHLLTHKLRCEWGNGLVFGRTVGTPRSDGSIRKRAARAWRHARLNAIGLHEARHTFASLMIAAGVNAKALSTYMGHSSVSITLDRYGHLMPGNESEAAALLDAYLRDADGSQRVIR